MIGFKPSLPPPETPLDRPGLSDWTEAYDNSGHIPDAAAFLEAWPRDAAAFRAALGPRAHLDLPYRGGLSDPERERLDLFLPEGEPRGLAVFVHGGYWLRFGREIWSHLAAGAVARGWAVAMPSYTLAPRARISAMVPQVARAVEEAARLVPGPIALAGHSAGGHLVSRLVCAGSALSPEAASRLVRTVSISGLHDLRPLRFTAMNESLGLDAAEAAAESAALHAPAPGARLAAWVGAEERPEFLRQSTMIAAMWGGLAETRLVVDPGRHHFDVIAPLAEADSPLTQTLADW
ncbi:alpha/beta hydrolase [Albimonas pacifica]|uniref:Acetyl esterase/lipase n=1 Tax=Albimonas pacifica TaxID=1114924 RepID=A0A1I3D3S4_9RHOB|nr:alpha/beta hydrolase [Albimonas pacifica]SFH81363.1 Acetyl esterase/lipase [Albimonas pacifica]